MAATAVIDRVHASGGTQALVRRNQQFVIGALQSTAVVDEFGRRRRLLGVVRRVTLPTQHPVELIGHDCDFPSGHSEDGREDLAGVW